MNPRATRKPLKSGQPLRPKSSLKSTTTLKTPNGGLKKPGKGLSKSSKTTVSKLKREADRVHSLATRLRFADRQFEDWWVHCITCGAYNPVKKMQCGHFQSRSHNATRYDEENTAPQCYGCNVMQQGRQYKFGIEIDKLYGDGTAARLYAEAQVPHPFKPAELEQIIADRRAEIAYYEGQA